MIKGGFQGLDISGVDLTAQSPSLPGAYAACAAADGKPIRVLTADGAVQCSVKKVSTNYVLAGITGDGKILSITVGSTDGISVSENVPGTQADYTFTETDKVDITGASEYDTAYVAPCDGYAVLKYSNDVAEGSTSIKLFRPAGQDDTTLIRIYANSSFQFNSVFVKKGMRIGVSKSGTMSSAYFYPLEEA